MAPEPTRVLLLTTDECGFCADARAVLRRLEAQYELRVETLALETPAGQELARRGSILFPPGTFVDGEPFAYGRLSERKLRRELARRGTALRTA